AVPIDEVLPSKELSAYGYKFNPVPVAPSEPIIVIPFTSTGPINNITPTENGFIVPAGIFEITVQLTAELNAGLLTSNFAIAINGEPIETTLFSMTSNSPVAGSLTIQKLNSGDVVSIVILNPVDLSTIPITGNFAIKKLN
ncbi:hypothetical protein, partial [Metasolibacillus meyeri]|uniref:hypothetical protein n=1 Tax=Metasolibacillus meyeri TaxID=1071052 RepID=UPI00187D6AE5